MSDRRQLLFVAVGVVVLLAFFFGVLKPRATEAADLRDRLSAAQAEEHALSMKLLELQQLELKRPEFEAEFTRLSRTLPKHAHVVRLVRLLVRASNQAGVDLRQMAPSKPSPIEEHGSAKSMTMSLIVTGSYDRIESFLWHLEQLERAVKVTAITLAPNQDEAGRTSLTGTITLQMYTFDPNAAASASSGGTSKTSPAEGAAS